MNDRRLRITAERLHPDYPVGILVDAQISVRIVDGEGNTLRELGEEMLDDGKNRSFEIPLGPHELEPSTEMWREKALLLGEMVVALTESKGYPVITARLDGGTDATYKIPVRKGSREFAAAVIDRDRKAVGQPAGCALSFHESDLGVTSVQVTVKKTEEIYAVLNPDEVDDHP